MRETIDPAISQQPPRERILLAAHQLFYRDGIRATGIDKIITESGVAKVTFYRHFPSKNDLILAFLDYRHQLWMAWFKAALERHGSGTKGIKALPKAMAEWFSNPIFRGCAFINSVAELGAALPEVNTACWQHKQEMVEAIAELLPPCPNQLEIAYAIALVVDGAIIKAQCQAGILSDGGPNPTNSLALAVGALVSQLEKNPT